MASGVICEYNPLHKGHQYHLDETRRLSGDPDILCIMSGNYTQRGEPAIVDKWVRTRMALSAGADIVIELPTYFSTASAPGFARGAVQLAFHAHIIRQLSFGVEPGTEPLLRRTASLMLEQPEEYEAQLRSALTIEKSYPRARARALSELLSAAGIQPDPALFSPNAILGLEYLLQLMNPHAPEKILPILIERESSDYASLDITKRFPSAAALREQLSRQSDITSLLPASSQAIWRDALQDGLAPVFPSSFSDAWNYSLSRLSAEELREIAEMTDALANRIQKNARDYPSWDLLLSELSSKSYPTARMRRILLNILLDITKERREAIGFSEGPPYLRILGYRREKEELLRQLLSQATLPVITSPTAAINDPDFLSPSALQALQDEIRFTDIYLSALPNPAARGRGYEYRAPLICL